MKKISVDLDGVICQLKRAGQSYAELEPVEGAIESLKQLKNIGYYIIINTARNMKTCDSNVGKVIKNVGAITLNWLNKHNVPYDEIYFGKPHCHLYLDDNGYRFKDWKSFINDLPSLEYAEDKLNKYPKYYDLVLGIKDMIKDYLNKTGLNGVYDKSLFIDELQRSLSYLQDNNKIKSYNIIIDTINNSNKLTVFIEDEKILEVEDI